MNFDKLFFQLLIIKTLYQCGLGQPTVIAPISEIIVLSDGNIKYTMALLGQYDDNEDLFFIVDSNQTLFGNYFKDNFSSKTIEFNCLYDLEMEFIYRRADDEQIIRFKCVFSENKFLQAFFQKIYWFQEKGDSVMIHRIALYFEVSQRIISYRKHATMYSKNISNFSNGIVERTYFITHFNETNSTMELEIDFIFSAKKFAMSDIYENNKIALCINGIPYERILIRFSDPITGHRFLTAHMPETMQRDDSPCEFPNNLTYEEIYEDLEKP